MNVIKNFLFFYYNQEEKIEYMSLRDPLENFDDLEDWQREEAEYKILEKAFNNSYKIITGEKTFEDILEAQKNGAILAHDPAENLKITFLQNMKDYFIETEEYEKCHQIQIIENNL